MTQPPYALVRAQLNAGAIQTGGITAAGGEVVQLSADPAGLVGATQYLWELLNFPPTFTCPSGWSTDANGNYTSAAQTPPPFTLLSAADFDKYIPRLTLNGGGPALTGRENAAQLEAIQALTTTATAIQVLSATGLTQIGFREEIQFAPKGWLESLRANLRILAAVIGGGGTGDVTGPGSSVVDRLVLMAGTTGKSIKQASFGVAELILRAGTVAMTGDLDLGTHKAINGATPTLSTDLATKAYVDARSDGGAGRGFPFTYAGSGTITDADPGAGIFRGNNATLASSTQLFIDDLAANGATGMSAWIASFDDQVGAVKGVLRIQSASDPTKFLEWPVTASTTASGYSKVTLGIGWGPGGITTTASDTLLSFDAVGVSANLNNQGLTNARIITYNGEIATTGATPAVDWTTGALQKTTLSANATPTFTAPAGPVLLFWHVAQNGTGGFTVAFPAAVKGNPQQPSLVANAETIYELYYDGTNYWPLTTLVTAQDVQGADLGDSSPTITVAGGTEYNLRAGTITTARSLTLGTGGSPEVGEQIILNAYAQGSAYNVLNGGPLGGGVGVIYTVVAGTRRKLIFEFNGANWLPPAIRRIAA